MYKCSLLLFLAGNVSPALSEEVARKHHKKHHKHHHGHHAHKKNPDFETHHATWKVSNHTNVVKIPPTPEEYAAVDAINAHNAANSAGEAANVATKVATHSVDINTHAQSALKKAQNVLKEARAGAGGLSVDQKELLKRAEVNLARATKTVTYNVGAVKYVNSKSVASPESVSQNDATAERAQLEYKLSKLQQQLDTKHQPVEVLQSENELAAMELEIHGLREQLDAQAAKSAAMRRDAEVQATQQELSELEAMIKELEVAEAKHQVKVNEHDEMKIELEKLRERVAQMENKASAPDTGTLVYEVPPKKQLPLRTVETGDDSAVAASAEADDESPQGVAVDGPPEDEAESTPVAEKGIDIDTAMPYGELEPFGREDTAQELTEDSVHESDEMVDQLERAEVAEEKRAVFRALTRLRGAAITSFDGIARSQTGNIDEYNKLHKWRRTHPLHHLADEESDISKWAFPDNADF
jgi:regulator of replication initiation timing